VFLVGPCGGKSEGKVGFDSMKGVAYFQVEDRQGRQIVVCDRTPLGTQI